MSTTSPQRQALVSAIQAANSDDVLDLCRRHVLHGTPFVFAGREDEFYAFRKRIADKFDVSFHEVFITGSAKLGYSLLKVKAFDYDSDVDVAIVSELLFERMMEAIRAFQMSLREARRAVTERELDAYHKFLEYTAIGWLRPDMLPVSFDVKTLKDDWFSFFKDISYGNSEVGNYKVSAGVFRTYRHLELYQHSGLVRFARSLSLPA